MPLPSREQAFELLCEHLKGEYLRRHSRATEAIMQRLAARLGQDQALWSITGLLHDLDLELVGEEFMRHGHETSRILEERFDYPAEGLQAILAHNGDLLGIPCVTPFDHALTAAESITGMVFATALILPTKRLGDVKPKSVAKRLKEPRFAAKVSRERVSHHEDLGIDAAAFCALAVESMQAIAGELED
ncbi:MAG: HD domain-containing protein [Polyangia bacterium]|jgi:predicted hydrolase (HD superfamily)|nr:HD domain-containing protein [Polyangia bacterium]